MEEMKLDYLTRKIERLSRDFSIYGIDALSTILLNNVITVNEIIVELKKQPKLSNEEINKIFKITQGLFYKMDKIDLVKDAIDNMIPLFTSIHLDQAKIKNILDIPEQNFN